MKTISYSNTDSTNYQISKKKKTQPYEKKIKKKNRNNEKNLKKK